MGEEALIDELWNRWFKTEISGSPVSDSCMHDFISFDMNERWCTECGRYLNSEVGKTLCVLPTSKTLRNLPCNTLSKEKYFLSVLENSLGEESLAASNLSALKILSDTHKQNIQARCVTRKDVQIFIKYVSSPTDRKLVNGHLGLFIRLCGAESNLSSLHRSHLISEYKFLLYQGQKIRPKSYLLSVLTKPISWVWARFTLRRAFSRARIALEARGFWSLQNWILSA